MISIGIICPSEIALRRFLPALKQLPNFKFAGVAIANATEWDNATKEIIEKEKEKAEMFIQQFGGELFHSYTELIESKEIDAVYLPLPPALHYKWAYLALQAEKHILVEKPATTALNETNKLLELAKQKNLAVHENYMFAFHNQLEAINNILNNKEIGDVRLYRITFGFPRRAANDFRYNKALGGGALLDAGGYTLKYASMLLGDTVSLVTAQSNYTSDFNVDIFGSATLVNNTGTTVQVAFGMDNAYKCELEVWGNKGYLVSGRVLTAPAGFIPEVNITKNNETVTRELPADDAFMKSILRFETCINNNRIRLDNYDDIHKQAKLVNEFLQKSNN